MPQTLWLLRHGESLANVARRRAEAENLPTIDFDFSEEAVPLSALGERQALAVGAWFRALPSGERPTVCYSSPYVRTTETAGLLLKRAELSHLKIFTDARLRERELGIFDRLTKAGALQRFPDECSKRQKIGKFHYRPPGGESWDDVAKRLRMFLQDLNRPGEKALLVTHEVVIHCLKFILEDLSEDGILSIDLRSDIENGSLTAYEYDARAGKMVLTLDEFLPEITK